jgi:chromate transporter
LEGRRPSTARNRTITAWSFVSDIISACDPLLAAQVRRARPNAMTGSEPIYIDPSLAILFLSFVRLGATAFGGPAMVAYIRRMAVEQQRWLDDAAFRDGVALCQTIPGATAMQVAAYVGFRARGVAGAAISFIAFGLPAFILMVGLSAFYARSYALPPVVAIFHGLQVIVVALVANATVTFGQSSLKRFWDAAIAIIAAGLFGWGVSPILVIALAALLGLIIYKDKPVETFGAGSARKSHGIGSLLIIAVVAALGFVLLFLLERRLFELAAVMLKVDLFAFGGGFASLPLMFHEIVEVRSWMDGQTFLNGIALGQITPGPIVITATFVGYMVHGLLGAVVATVGVFLPSFLIVVGAASYFDKLRRSAYFTRALSGILGSFVGLLLMVTFRFASAIPWNVPRSLLAAAAFIALLSKAEIIWVVLAGTIISLLFL